MRKPDCRSRKQKRSDKPITVTFPRFVIGLVLPLLLATPVTQFSLDRKRRSRKRINHNADYASDYDSDSDSIVSENQP